MKIAAIMLAASMAFQAATKTPTTVPIKDPDVSKVAIDKDSEIAILKAREKVYQTALQIQQAQQQSQDELTKTMLAAKVKNNCKGDIDQDMKCVK